MSDETTYHWIDSPDAVGRQEEIFGAGAALHGVWLDRENAEAEAEDCAAELEQMDADGSYAGVTYHVESGPCLPDWARFDVAEYLIDAHGIEHPTRWHGPVRTMDEAKAQFFEAVQSGAYHMADDPGPGERREVTARLALLDQDDEVIEEATVRTAYEPQAHGGRPGGSRPPAIAP